MEHLTSRVRAANRRRQKGVDTLTVPDPAGDPTVLLALEISPRRGGRWSSGRAGGGLWCDGQTSALRSTPPGYKTVTPEGIL